ncbi:hypothetical protein GGTG_02187 [Gaeumannomyces tritici R3-111a-1]|uniref:Uncharacterized protein n=1 Tax=Gaeumannomyces tritici (strain R3-111a-1) TaxID=644352 RepID=J3NLN7_GAET3|nr:hypothetical protein GGTG_02187 [Gaeumannomyces tritici R3-111a-1]EJT82213.1 hypothetical protein GGTG_02187 [Gaeumannomyces tritici R3-111a-1]
MFAGFHSGWVMPYYPLDGEKFRNYPGRAFGVCINLFEKAIVNRLRIVYSKASNSNFLGGLFLVFLLRVRKLNCGPLASGRGLRWCRKEVLPFGIFFGETVSGMVIIFTAAPAINAFLFPSINIFLVNAIKGGLGCGPNVVLAGLNRSWTFVCCGAEV